jgi:hypothetical protein
MYTGEKMCIIQLFKKTTKKLDFPKSTGKISMREVALKLENDLGMSNIYLSDENFDLTTVTEAQKFTEETKVAAAKYVSEGHDCDNFSFALMGYWSEGLKSFALGIAWSGDHAFNVFFDDQKNLWIVEPQTNEYLTLDQAKTRQHYWPIELVIM